MLTVVSHDAGGAEVLSSLVSRLSEPYRLVLEGPATAIFEKKLGHFKPFGLEEALVGSDWVLTGTSWASDLEIDAIRKARKAEIRSVSFLDHWVHYLERFQSGSSLVLPDEIWVGDDDALRMAIQIFPNINKTLVPNPYFEDIRTTLAQMKECDINHEQNVLYLCEPVREHAMKQDGDDNAWGYTEESALLYFLANKETLEKDINQLVIRPHPSEAVGKYAWALDNCDIPVRISKGRTLLEDISEAGIVVGCESTALVIGLISGKRAVSCIPMGGRPCSLPHARIEHLQSLVKDKTGTHA